MVAVRSATTGYRLPSEAEWVYAARVAGRQSAARYPWPGTYPPTKTVGNFADARIVWAAAARLKVGGQARWFDTAGSFGHTTRDLSAFVEIGFGKGYVGHLGYRDVDYTEVDQDWDDYRARITEVSIGYRW